LLKKYNFRPNTVKGQNFLVEDSMLDKIVSVASVGKNDVVLEIGAGVGNLTSRLAQTAKQVVTIESDRRFEPILTKLSQVNDNVSVIYGDALKVEFKQIQKLAKVEKNGDYIVVANIPYYITSSLIYQIIKYPVLPRSINILVQKEVGQRIVASAGNHSKLSLSVQFYGDPAISFMVSRKNFYPQPEVDSSMLTISNVHSWNYEENEKHVWQLITFGFSSKRKKLINNLAAGLQEPKAKITGYLSESGIDPKVRAQDLTVENWLRLTSVVH